jgi:HAD superfamily hydrolase (TIGR01509 family)
MIKGVIFDIDGVIVDSEPLHMEALLAALQREIPPNLPVAAGDLIGLSLEETIARFKVAADRVPSIKEATIAYYIANLKPELIRPKIKRLWLALLKNGIKFGCVSSAEMRVCQNNLGLLGIDRCKEAPVVAFESVSRTKPHPLPYLTMLDQLRLRSEEVIVLEDSDTGITAASAAGINNIYAWPHRLSTAQKYRQAYRVITELSEVEFLKQWLE